MTLGAQASLPAGDRIALLAERGRQGCLRSQAPRVTLHTAYFFVLNYDAMKRLNLNPYAGLLVLVALLSACSEPAENSGPTNTSAPQQANSNPAPQPQIAQGNAPDGAPSPVPLAVQPIPPPPAPAEKSAAEGSAKAANAASVSTAGKVRAPKLVVPDKKIDFGKQPQDKTLVRAIVIKNGGLADLKIESVVPS